MDDVLLHRSAGGHNFRRRSVGGGGRRLAPMSSPALPPSAYGFFPYPAAPPGPFLYPPYNLYSCGSLPPLPFNHPGLPPRPPATAAKHATFPYQSSPMPPRPAAVTKVKQTAATGMSVSAPRKMLEGKSKKPRTPRSTEEPPRAQRRKPLQRAAPLPATSAVTEALDDLEREVTRGFVEDLLHALAPPPSSLPLPTFSLVRAAATKVPAPCTV
ncbi:verprolin-like [Hordeum vulgare subsp. vulgare]|uniref:Uncharacterized protein n=1 Tax=Hordeum vulgare subsp. vulgare TaxID=112509 RepID=A0A287UTN5_HORVV|nr:verprolin-like [Hordeum vulgare subsp. vulgare]